MKQDIEQAIAAAVKKLFGDTVAIELTRPDEQFGDYATNVALQLAGRSHKNPREVAETLQEELRKKLSGSAVMSIAGPGFLNIRLSDAALLDATTTAFPQPLKGKTYVTDYSDPNWLKPMHIGHFYSTLVGDVISRLIERAGATTIRINYGGDVGLHVGKTMWAIVKALGGELPEKLSDIPVSERTTWLGARYVEGNTAYEDDEVAKTEIVTTNKRVYRIHADGDHESPFAQIYWLCRQWSYEGFEAFYAMLQVTPFARYIPESEIAQLGLDTVKTHTAGEPGVDEARAVYTRSDNAIVFLGEKFGLHTRVFVNSEGLPTYEAKDVGLIQRKWEDYRFDKSIIITAKEQAEYMKVVVASIRQFEPELAAKTLHITHGTVLAPGGVKMSSRKGNVITPDEILESARQASEEAGMHSSHETILAAVKYAFAKNRIGGDFIYDPKESIAIEGNSGPYLQYAHARARSILAKATASMSPIGHLEPAERSLVRKISEYGEVVEKATAELLPHYICTYLYELAQVFNSFYEHNRIIGDAREDIRLQLIERYADTLKSGLGLLGITAPDKM